MKSIVVNGRIIAYLCSTGDLSATRGQILSALKDAEPTTVHRAIAELTLLGVIQNHGETTVVLAEAALDSMVFSINGASLTSKKSWLEVACPQCNAHKYTSCRSRNAVLSKPHKTRCDAANGAPVNIRVRHGNKAAILKSMAIREDKRETGRREANGSHVAHKVLANLPKKPPGRH